MPIFAISYTLFIIYACVRKRARAREKRGGKPAAFLKMPIFMRLFCFLRAYSALSSFSSCVFMEAQFVFAAVIAAA